MTVHTERSARRVASARLERVARRLLRASTLCALATVSPGGRAHVNTMYFASDGFDIVWISAPDSRHSRNVRERGTAAVAVFDSHQRWGGQDSGIQVFGRARELRGRAALDAMAAYGRRFHAGRDVTERFRAYRLRTTRVKLFDESEFGGAKFVVAQVRGGALEWEVTEAYRE